METEHLDQSRVEAWRNRTKFINVVTGNVEAMKKAHDALLAFARPCLGTDEAIIQLQNSINYSNAALEEQ